MGSQEDQLKAAQALLTLRSPVVTGIDLLGDETNMPTLEKGQAAYATVLRAVRDGKSSLHRTMHAGELGDPRNPRDALILGVERIGHGVKLAADPIALEYAARNGIAVEINLISNLRLQAIDDLDQHPFLDYLRLGLPVSLSTDDEGILDTDINTECVTAITRSDISYSELKAMAFNSIRTSFADAETRQRLEARLTELFRDFERKHSVSSKAR